jgi:hypothetical protein
MQAQAIRVPAVCSPLEGVYLLAVLLHRQEERLEDLRSRPSARFLSELDSLEADLRELHWRARVILGAAEGGPGVDVVLQALLLKTGLELEPAAASDRPAERLERAEQNAALLGEIARQCRLQFAASPYTDEFRLCQELSEQLGQQLARLRN